MAQADAKRRDPKQLTELRDVLDFLEEVRLRPQMWVRSLVHLESALLGYRVALEVHGLTEEFNFWPQGPFAQWLWVKLGHHSSLGWAAEIEREAQAASIDPMAMFFMLLDEYRADHERHAAPAE